MVLGVGVDLVALPVQLVAQHGHLQAVHVRTLALNDARQVPPRRANLLRVLGYMGRLSPRLPWWILTYRSKYANLPKYCGNELILHSTYRFWNLLFIVESDDFI